MLHMLYTIFLATALCVSCCSGVQVDLKASLVWGPGLKAPVVLPARYFFVQPINSQGLNITESLGEKAFTVNIYKKNGERIRVWTQVFDRHDGSYIVRYKLFSTAKDLMMDVLHNGRHVAQSPYTLKGVSYHEKCDCPKPKMSEWLQDMGCPSNYRQIKRDLSLFKSIDMEQVAKEAVARFNQKGRHSLCHYVVKDNKIYRKTYGQHVGFKMFSDEILLSLTRKVVLPDLEFFVNLGDWPLEKKAISEDPIPIISWCGSDDSRDIILPTYDITESTLQTMGRVTLDMISVQGNTGPLWHNKSDVAFWRGRDSRQERLDLVKLSRKHPDILDAKLTNMFFFEKDEEKYGEIVKHVSFFDFFKYKYQINLDGTVAAYRLPYLMAGDSVVFKQDSPYYEFFYKELVPYEHYIPINRNISDLLEKLQWAKDNDEKAQQIAKNAQAFARDKLLGRDVFCYHVVLFNQYAKRLKSSVSVHEGMELVEQPNLSSDRDTFCECDRKPHKQPNKDEL